MIETKAHAKPIHETQEQVESLAMALRGVLLGYEQDVDYDDLNAALGSALAFTADVRESCPAWWVIHARDRFLTEVGKLVGLTIRDLHPREAAEGLATAREFGEHFRDSYVPLIIEALRNDQPVLAWQGWPDHLWGLWGVITAYDERAAALIGSMIWVGGRRTALIGPAVQCYVVEKHAERTPSDPEWLAACARHGGAFLRDEVEAGEGIVTGPRAFNEWQRRLQQTPFCQDCGEHSWSALQQLAVFLVCNRLGAARFFRRMADHRRPGELDPIIKLCKHQSDLLRPYRDAAVCTEALTDDAKRNDLLAAITHARALEEQLGQRLGDLTIEG
jgi:hypothetical protein